METKKADRRIRSLLKEDNLTNDWFRDLIRQDLPEPSEVSISGIDLDEVLGILSLDGTEGSWESQLFQMVGSDANEGPVSVEVKRRALRLAFVYARDEHLSVTEVVPAVEDGVRGLRKEAQSKADDAAKKVEKASKVTEGMLQKLDTPSESEARGILGLLAPFFGGVATAATAVKAWNERERSSFHRDVRTAQVGVWQRVVDALQTLPEQIYKLESALVTSEQGALSAHQSSAAVAPKTESLSWESPESLALRLTDSDPDPTLPTDLLVELSKGEELALGLIEQEAAKVARQQVAALKMAMLEGIHGPIVRNVGQAMLQRLNRGAGENGSHLFQVGEQDSDGSVSSVYPAVPQQTAALAAPGPAIAIGFIRVDLPQSLEQVAGDNDLDSADISEANPFVNLELARRHAVSGHHREEVA